MECPRCGSPEVHVPWEPAVSRRRRMTLRGMMLLWALFVLATLAGWLNNDILWAVGLAGAVAVTLFMGVAVYLNTRTYRCVACRLKWRP